MHIQLRAPSHDLGTTQAQFSSMIETNHTLSKIAFSYDLYMNRNTFAVRFTNFSPHHVQFEGHTYPTAEHCETAIEPGHF